MPTGVRPTASQREAVDTAGAVQLFMMLALAAYATWPLPSSGAASALVHLLPALPAACDLRWARLLRDDLIG
jgi:hypothetical protein